MINTKIKPTYETLNKLMFTSGNPKTDKNLKIESLKKYWIKRLNLAPASISGFNTCASASEGCRNACLHEAGNPVFMPQKTLGRVNRTLLYFKDRARFLSMITKEIRNHEKNFSIYIIYNDLLDLYDFTVTCWCCWWICNLNKVRLTSDKLKCFRGIGTRAAATATAAAVTTVWWCAR